MNIIHILLLKIFLIDIFIIVQICLHIQLGIEMNDDTKNYHAVCEESNSIKQKCGELEEQLKTLLFEKEHTDEEYRQYIENMKEKLHQTCSEVSYYFRSFFIKKIFYFKYLRT